MRKISNEKRINMKNKQLSVIRCYYAAKPPPCVRHKQNGLRINQKKKSIDINYSTNIDNFRDNSNKKIK